MKRKLSGAVVALLLTCATAFAQQTTGVITGRVVDQQGAAVPGVTVTAKSPSTGFTRTETSDAEGVYRLAALPVGLYEVTAELQGFSTVSKKDIEVNVGQTQSVDFPMKVAALAETVNVTGATPLIQTTSSSVGAVVDIKRIESLPLNGRQFANLAATVPGVGLGFHSDPTKSTQYAPQINGGAGRNVNYQIDGGDNNDDTVGGLVQNFPLDSIGEFNFETQRFRADTGRANGGTIKVVTKSGTNDFRGDAFELFRDKSLNGKSHTEETNNLPKGDYRKHQFGAALGGPIVKDKTHFFMA
ncbi:MAG: carboxypeptidase regulatory-like domain-containing protein, partial [Acidobacteria bacterium]|nr:carboxypeptidase regulatory-like domain-containing protein [Acidobacteriota bacterium]